MLHLQACEVERDGRWLWRLFDSAGSLVAHHAVAVDDSVWEWEALRDLPGRVAPMVDPADRLGSEQGLVDRVGRWTTTHVLGPVADALADRAPVVVSVTAPEEAPWLWGLPLGVAVVRGHSLALQRVVFAARVDGVGTPGKVQVGERLRALAVFSAPVGEPLLDLRRERYRLAGLARQLTGAKDRPVDLRILQYGATRERLREALADGEGWDVVHVSCHGAAGRLVLEDSAGRPDPVQAADLVGWLRDARHRLKLVTLAACSSAAFTVAETLQRLGIEVPVPAAVAADGDGQGVHSLALEVAREAECSVVAMRYPVVDDFAIDFVYSLFDGLWDKGQPAADAVGWAVREAARVPPTAGAPALSAFTPAVFSRDVADVRLVPPKRTGLRPEPDTRMAGFDEEPARFVGRVGVITRANAVLAHGSGRSGVLFHGMAGAGKTACALELAYGQRDNFPVMVWFRCPPEGADGPAVSAALDDIAGKLDLALGVPLAGTLRDPGRFEPALAGLTEVIEQQAALVVVDNAESLLTPGREWLDPRWGQLVDALTRHRGLGRLVVTSRLLPATVPAGMAVEAIHALTREEAVLLARRLPNLGRLLEGEPVATRDGHQLARAVLAATGGHPELLKLADAQLTDPEALDRMLTDASRAWDDAGIDPAEFLSTPSQTGSRRGDDALNAYLDVLHDWAARAAAGLDDAGRLLLQMLCRATDEDRTDPIVDGNWADLWHRLGRPDPVPQPEPLLERLAALALIDRQHPGPGSTARFSIHPAVVETVAAVTPPDVADAVDTELAACWVTITQRALDDEKAGHASGHKVVVAARHAVIYLLRRREWALAAGLLERVVHRDRSPAVLTDVVALLRRVADRTSGTDDELATLGILANALLFVDRDEARQLLGDVETRAVASGRHDLAGGVAGSRSAILIVMGRFEEAVAAADAAAEHNRTAGFGPWTQLADQVRRLQLLTTAGRNEQVLTDVDRLRAEMADYPDPPGPDDRTVNSWNVRETLYAVAGSAALNLRRWTVALEYVNETVASRRRRGVSALETAATGFDAYGPLLRLGRVEEARDLLERCRAVFERHGAYPSLAKCLSALADVENTLGHGTQAADLERIALRFGYLRPEPISLAASHFNLANSLDRWAGDRTGSITHRLAAAMLERAAGSGLYPSTRAALGRALAGGTSLPADFDALCHAVEQVDGVQFRQLLGDMGAEGDDLLDTVVGEARATPPSEIYAEHLRAWESALALLAAACSGHAPARAHLNERLAAAAGSADWTHLADRLARIRDGERDPAILQVGLDPVDSTVLERALDAIAGRVLLDLTPEPLRPLVDGVLALAVHARGTGPAPEADLVTAIHDRLTALAGQDDWTALAGQLQQLAAGTTDLQWDNLDDIDTAILCTALDRLQSRLTGG